MPDSPIKRLKKLLDLATPEDMPGRIVAAAKIIEGLSAAHIEELEEEFRLLSVTKRDENDLANFIMAALLQTNPESKIIDKMVGAALERFFIDFDAERDNEEDIAMILMLLDGQSPEATLPEYFNMKMAALAIMPCIWRCKRV